MSCLSAAAPSLRPALEGLSHPQNIIMCVCCMLLMVEIFVCSQRFQRNQPLVANSSLPYCRVEPSARHVRIGTAGAASARMATTSARMATTRQRGDELVDERLVALEALASGA